MRKITVKMIYAIGALFCWGALLYALYSQYVLELLPCAYCIVQRMVYVLLGLFFTIQWLGSMRFEHHSAPKGGLSRSVVTLKEYGAVLWLFALSVFGAFVGVYQWLFSKVEGSCGFSWAQVLIDYSKLEQLAPALFEVKALCSASAAYIFRVPYELYSVAGFLFLGIISVLALVKLWQGDSDA